MVSISLVFGFVGAKLRSFCEKMKSAGDFFGWVVAADGVFACLFADMGRWLSHAGLGARGGYLMIFLKMLKKVTLAIGA